MRWLYRREFSSKTYQFDDLLLDASFSLFGKSAIDAHAYVQRNVQDYWGKLLGRLQEERRAGRTPLFDVVDSSSRRVSWPPAKYSISHPEKKTYRKLLSRPTLIQAIDKLNHREYEALPCFMIELVRGGSFSLTPSGNEWGVDFFGLLQNPSHLPIFDGCRAPARIVGQCKKYGDAAARGCKRVFANSGWTSKSESGIGEARAELVSLPCRADCAVDNLSFRFSIWRGGSCKG